MILNNLTGVQELNNDDIIEITNSNIIIYEKTLSKYNKTFKIKNSNVKIFSYELNKIDSLIKFDIFENSNVEVVYGFFGIGNSEILINLLEKDAKIDIKTVACSNKESFNQTLTINHLATDTQGLNENFVVAKNSNIKYDIVGKIIKGMKRSKCSQKTRGIVIEKGLVEADPVLLIDECDVMANHGACIGKISDEGLFYLMSRGITKEESLVLIVNGFLNPIYNIILDEQFRNDFIEASKLNME